MPKSIYVQFLLERPNSNPHYLNRLVKILTHFISIEPLKKTRGYEDHHIVPKAKSWKPEWDKVSDNHLKVPVKAHYVIHHLLWKAFPKDYAMTVAFHKMTHGQQKQKITSKIFEILKSEIIELQSNIALKKVINKTHPFLGGEMQKKLALERVANKTHNFLGSNNNSKRVAEGTHPFLGGEVSRNNAERRITDKTHNFLGSNNNSKQLSNGTHPSQIKKTCPHCGKTCSLGPYKKYHDEKCKLKLAPL
jgi:hypothetical protein